jgi:UDP-N-acetylglucosamine 2-epimerase (non-hydrolysing)
VKWLFAIFTWFLSNVLFLRRSLPKNTILVVHGDTLTTVVGAIFAKFLGRRAAHVEAGLRSGDWRNPFPEELDRVITGKLASIHYVPTEAAERNLKNKKNILFTHGNTVIDSLTDAPRANGVEGPKYAVCLLHRFELMSNSELILQSFLQIAKHSQVPVRLFLDEFSRASLDKHLTSDVTQVLKPEKKVPYFEFVQILNNAEFVITDSGGIQAECEQLGVPTLIHRKTTEQWAGFGENLVLSGLEPEKIGSFIDLYREFSRPSKKPSISPSQLIVEDLIKKLKTVK